MSNSRTMNLGVTVVAASVVAACGFLMSRNVVSAAPAPTALTAETFEAVKKRILPTAADLAWQQVDWRDGFFEGVMQAQAQDKPIFLWIYEGHPQGGC